MAETEGSDDTSDELLNKSLSVWSAKSALGKEKFEPIPLDLHTASSLGQYDCVKNYITRGEVDLDKRNKGGWTAVMYACYIGHDSIVNLLLDADISVNIRNHKGETPLMLAASCGNERVGYLLCSHNAELEVKDERGWTALFHATYSGHQNMVRFLLEQGANINAVEQSVGMTPFMEAAAEGHEIILQLFLQHGVNVNAKAYNGDTARSLALINGNMKIVSLIDNHVMPITSLRSEPGLETDLSSSDDAFSKNKPMQRGKARIPGGGPSIMDGPQAIARLIDRTREPKQEDGLVPKGYVTFPEEDATSPASNKLSHRDVTSPINPDDYKLDSSGGRDSFDHEDDTNAFSKTGALTIKSSSGSSGGLAAALGIRREDSLDSDEFPHESSCEDYHPHGNSGDSSSEDGVDEAGLSNQIAETLKVKSADDKANKTEQQNSKSVKRKKSKEKLTTENVNEIEVLKNSVSEWIDSVHDTHPIPEDNIEPISSQTEVVGSPVDNKQSPAPQVAFEKDSALKPEYQHTRKDLVKSPDQIKFPSKTFDIGVPDCHVEDDVGISESNSSARLFTNVPTSSHSNQNHASNSDFFDQVAKKVQALDQHTQQDFSHQPVPGASEGSPEANITQGNVVQYEPSVDPVSALNLLNTATDSTNVTQEPALLSKANPGHQNPTCYHGNHHPNPTMPLQVTAGFPPGFNAYQMFPQGVTPSFSHVQTPTSVIYPSSISAITSQVTVTEPSNATVQSDIEISSNTVFMEKMGDAQPSDLATFLNQLGLSKYLPTFEEQDVDLQVFLSLTDNDLKEVGIKLFGPRKKMTNAIARWHGKARVAVGELEQAYANRLEGEMQEMGSQLQMACEQLEKMKAQVKQEQQLRNVTETCLMEERAAWQQVQRIIMETRQQCEDFKDVVRKLKQYLHELKARVPLDPSPGQQKRPIRGQNALREDFGSKTKGMLASDQLPTDSVVRKVDYYMQEIQHLLAEVTGNTDRLLGRNSQPESPDRGFT